MCCSPILHVVDSLQSTPISTFGDRMCLICYSCLKLRVQGSDLPRIVNNIEVAKLGKHMECGSTY